MEYCEGEIRCGLGAYPKRSLKCYILVCFPRKYMYLLPSRRFRKVFEIDAKPNFPFGKIKLSIRMCTCLFGRLSLGISEAMPLSIKRQFIFCLIQKLHFDIFLGEIFSRDLFALKAQTVKVCRNESDQILRYKIKNLFVSIY